MKKFISNITVATLAFLPMVVNAQTPITNPGQGIINLKGGANDVTKGVFNKDIGAQNSSITAVVINVINWVLGFLGIAAVVLIIYGGILWMTSGGSDAGVKKGKTIIQNAVIGLAIILGAYIIVNFVITNLINITQQ